MRKILVLGAGRSAPFLIRFLLDRAEEGDWQVTVGDRHPDLAAEQIAGHPRGAAIPFQLSDEEERVPEIEAADVVVNLLPPQLQPLVARHCLAAGTPMVSASYRDARLLEAEAEARRKGVILLTEIGLDPGIDLMSAMEMIARIQGDGGRIVSFKSYGSGVPAPDSLSNPLRYAVTWNPRNVVMAGEHGAQYLQDGTVKIVPWHRLFQNSWPVEVAGVGTMEAYPNRDSVSYREALGLDGVETLIRGTLRYPGWCETWLQLVRLGLPNETFPIPGLTGRSYRELVETFLPGGPRGCAPRSVEERVASSLDLSPTGRVMENLRWLGLFSDEIIGGHGETPAAALVELLKRRLTLPEGGRDMIILLHDLEVQYPDEGGRRERVTATFVEEGEPGGLTAMSRTVGLPMALAARLILDGRLELEGGCPLPTDPLIYRPLLEELAAEGVEFTETVTPLE